MNGRNFLILFSLSSIVMLYGFFHIFKLEAKKYVKNDQVKVVKVISDEKVLSLLNKDSRLDNGHKLFKSICYKCHVIEKQEIPNTESAVGYFNDTYLMIVNGNKKGMPSYKQRLQQRDIEDLSAFLTKIRKEFKVKQSR